MTQKRAKSVFVETARREVRVIRKHPNSLKKVSGYLDWGLFVGAIVLLMGFTLVICNVINPIEVNAYLFGVAIHISSAMPGVVFGILGVFTIYITRPR